MATGCQDTADMNCHGCGRIALEQPHAEAASAIAALHAVELLLNVCGDGLDLSAQLLLNLEPTGLRRTATSEWATVHNIAKAAHPNPVPVHGTHVLNEPERCKSSWPVQVLCKKGLARLTG